MIEYTSFKTDQNTLVVIIANMSKQSFKDLFTAKGDIQSFGIDWKFHATGTNHRNSD